jgi:hypothetical protein
MNLGENRSDPQIGLDTRQIGSYANPGAVLRLTSYKDG